MCRSGLTNGVSLLPPSHRITSASCSAARRMLLVVDAGEDEVSLGEMRLVLLTLLDRRIGGLEILVALEALHGLFRRDLRTASDGAGRRRACRLRGAVRRRAWWSGSCRSPCGPRRSRRSASLEASIVSRGEIRSVRGAGRERARADVHHVLVRHVRVGEDDDVDLVLADELLERGLGQDRNAFRIQRPRQLGGVTCARRCSGSASR